MTLTLILIFTYIQHYIRKKDIRYDCLSRTLLKQYSFLQGHPFQTHRKGQDTTNKE